MKNTLLKISLTTLLVDKELTLFADDKVQVIVSHAFLDRCEFLQDLLSRPYTKETYPIEGEWDDGSHFLFKDCSIRSAEVLQRRVVFIFSYQSKEALSSVKIK